MRNLPAMKTLVVDDSAVFRRTVSKALEGVEGLEVVGVAANGNIALQMIRTKRPDLVVLDVEMPAMDGLETLRNIRRDHPRVKVIMFSAHTQEGASSTIEALSLGAADFVTKPSGGSFAASAKIIQDELVPKILALRGPVAPSHRPLVTPRRPVPKPAPRVRLGTKTPPLIAVGSSTGGPNALADVLSKISSDFRSPMVITQHMPPMFTAQLAKRLNKLCPLEVSEAQEGDIIKPAHAYVAPGDYHMEIHRNPQTKEYYVKLQQGPKENSCRPAVDVMYRSISSSYGANVIGVILTGMGQDGYEGGKLLKACDGYMVAQDKDSCVVYGMPSYIVNNGLADEVLPLDQIGQRLNQLVREW